MQLRPEQVSKHSQQPLLPIYVIGGGEPLLIQESCDQLRTAAAKQGFLNREVYHVDNGFDWHSLIASTSEISLFGDKKLVEVRLATGKPGDAGGKALTSYCQNPSPDTVMLVICDKLESAARRSKWFKTIESTGASLFIWPIDAAKLPQWINRRLNDAGLSPQSDAVALLADRVEGNLLAARQEIEKIALRFPGESLSSAQVADCVVDNSRHTVFELVDVALRGELATGMKMLDQIQAEGIDASVVVWALSRELRMLCHCAEEMRQQHSIERLLANYRVFDRRKGLVKNVLTRVSADDLMRCLKHIQNVDRVAKGFGQGNPWDEISQILAILSTKPLKASQIS